MNIQNSGLHNRKQPWNPCADQTNDKTVSSQDNSISNNITMPKNSHEFQKFWRKCQKDKIKKYQYLISIGGSSLAKIFQAEISMGLLGEVIDILNENWKAEDFFKIYNILQSLSSVKRFGLSLQFLSNQEKEQLVKLFQKLNEVVDERPGERRDDDFVDCDLRILQKHYGVTIL